MSDKSTSASNGGIGFAGLLTIVFVTLKLLNKIAWSWWWVISPVWIVAAAVIAFVIIFILISALVEAVRQW